MTGRAVQDPWQVVQDSVRHWYWMPLTVLALGLASIALLVGNTWIRGRLIEQDVELVRSVAEIESRTALTHLWIEEYVSGDVIDLSEIDRHLERSAQLIDGILENLLASRRSLFTGLPEDPTVPALAQGVGSQLAAFEALTSDRREGFRRSEPVAIGSAVDVEYDRVFRRLSEEIQALAVRLDRRLVETEARSEAIQLGIVAAWSLLVLLAAFGLWTRERRRKRAESALRESQGQLLQVQKMDAVGRLAGGIAHDINNYLAAITAQCELARMKSDDPKVAAKMDAVLATADRASGLIRQLLAFSRRQPVQPRPVDLNRTVSRMEKMLRRLLGEDIQLDTHLAPDLWSVQIDAGQAEQILLNLVVNAREAMPEGGRILIETGNRKGPQQRVRLLVQDTGPGVPPGLRAKIFEPFFTTKDPSTSSGLGLSTVLGIVEQNGGVVRLEESAGPGAAFAVELPRCRQSARDSPPETALRIPARGGGERILLVEDNRELRESTRQILQAHGYRVDAAGDPEAALRLADEIAPELDLVISDVVLPGMSGKALADRLGARHRALPFLFVSGHADDVVLRHGIETGQAAFLQKPFDARALTAKIRELLDPRP